MKKYGDNDDSDNEAGIQTHKLDVEQLDGHPMSWSPV